MDNQLFYLESQLLCVVFMAILLRFNAHSLQGVMKHTARIGCLAMVASVMDILRIASGTVFGASLLLEHICTVVYLGCFGFVGYFWLKYCLQSFQIKNKVWDWIFLIPALAVLLVVVLSAKTEWVYAVDANGVFYRKELYAILLVDYLYVIVAGIAAVVAAQKEKNQRLGREYLMTAAFSAPVLVSGVLIFVHPQGLSTVTYAIFLTLLMVHCDLQHKRMVTDNLTKLPNRYGMDDEIAEQLCQYKRDKNDSFYIIVCDMDNFKTINDTWGHLEGDRALKLIANALMKVSQAYQSEVFRIGGDEFVIITDTSESGLADRVCDAVKKELDGIDFRDDFDIRMSMGVSLYDGSCTISELINGADKKLYQAKKKQKTE